MVKKLILTIHKVFFYMLEPYIVQIFNITLEHFHNTLGYCAQRFSQIQQALLTF